MFTFTRTATAWGILMMLLAAVLSITFLPAKADAATTNCWFVGRTNIYVAGNDPIILDPSKRDVFWEYNCRQDGFRLFRSNANTADEVKQLRRMVNAPHSYPDLYCSTGKNKGYLLGLRWSWTQLNDSPWEFENWRRWSTDYAAKNGCI